VPRFRAGLREGGRGESGHQVREDQHRRGAGARRALRHPVNPDADDLPRTGDRVPAAGALPKGAVDDLLGKVRALDMAEIRRSAVPYENEGGGQAQ
jgi:hypothetical protein